MKQQRCSMVSTLLVVLLALVAIVTTEAFVAVVGTSLSHASWSSSVLAATEEKAAPMVSGSELEVMLTEWDTPLVVDAYATWYVMAYRELYILCRLHTASKRG